MAVNISLSSSSPTKKPLARALDVALAFLLVVFTVLAVRYQYFLLKHMEWGDESETIVTAKMMAAGRLLYSEIFNHHGPLTFLAGVVVEYFGDFGVRGHRVPIALLQMAGLLAIYHSPIFQRRIVKLACTFFAATIIIFYLPDLLGHMYTYQAITGLFLLIILFLYTFPALIQQNALTSTRVIAGCALIACLPFLAITYTPIAGILFLISLRANYLKPAVIGLVASIGCNFIFLIAYGSLPGYLAFHLYLNSEILPFYLDSPTLGQFILIALISSTQNIAQYIYLAFTATGILLLASREKGFPWRSGLLALGVGSLLIRGSDFHGLPYYYTLLSFILLLALRIDKVNFQAKLIGGVFISICIAKASLLIPGERQNFLARKVPQETEFSKLVKKFTNKEDRIIAYSFQNYQYIAADRLPASGYFFYLPWQEEYNKDPKYGIQIDACKDIAEYRPKVMLIDKWNVWGRSPWESYAGCIQDLVDVHYTQVPNKPYYIRNDLYTADALAP